MNIYSPIEITEEIRSKFKPTRLYIKELSGVKYFGKTTRKDVHLYNGSGKIWRNRIKKYGETNIKTLWVSEFYYDPEEIQKIALEFSRENNIVESKIWANYKPENGLDGGFFGYKWYSKGIEERLSLESPGADWVLGRKNSKAKNKGLFWFNNGIKQKFCKEAPSAEWIKGMLPILSRKLPRGPYSEKRKLTNSLAQKNRVNIKRYSFIHDIHGKEFCSTGELINKYPNLYRSGVYFLVKGKIEELHGWKIEK